jgi:hypothetical protein
MVALLVLATHYIRTDPELDESGSQDKRGEGLGFLTEQQGQQDDLEVPELRLAEAGAEGLGELAQSGIHP